MNEGGCSIMFSFVCGLICGAAGMYYGSAKVRENLVVSVIASQSLWDNEKLLQAYVYRRIMEMKQSGEFDEFMRSGEKLTIDVRNMENATA